MLNVVMRLSDAKVYSRCSPPQLTTPIDKETTIIISIIHLYLTCVVSRYFNIIILYLF